MNRHAMPAIALLCHPYNRGGVTRWMIDAAIAWSSRGGRCWFVSPTPRKRIARANSREAIVDILRSERTAESLTIVTRRVGYSFELGTHAHRAFTYAALIREAIPALVPIIVSDDADVWAAAAMLADRNPMIGILHSDERKYYELARRHSDRLSALVSVSNRISATVDSIGAQIETATISCGVPIDTSARLRRRADGITRLIWIGRIEEYQKRVTDLPRIMQTLRAAGHLVTLDVVGDGPDRAELEREIGAAGLSEVVTLHGWRDRGIIRALLDNSDILLLPSNFEGMPIVAMEALSNGCAVVASRTSGVEDIAGHALARDCFWAYPIGDVNAAAECVMQAAAVSPLARYECALRLAKAEFSIDHCIERYRDLILGLAPLPTAKGEVSAWQRHFSAVISYPVSLWRWGRITAS